MNVGTEDNNDSVSFYGGLGLNCCDGKVGVTINPPKPALITDLMIRPELRYDRSLNGTHPFNDSSDQDMFTAAVDFVVTF